MCSHGLGGSAQDRRRFERAVAREAEKRLSQNARRIGLSVAAEAIMSIALFLIPKTAVTITIGLSLIFLLGAYIIWMFWWIRDSLLRRIVVICIFLSGLVIFGYSLWDKGIKLTFKDSPALTWWREQIITYDLAGVQRFISNLGIGTPSNLPPISVATGGLSDEIGRTNAPNLPLNRSTISIGVSALDNRHWVTEDYLSYVADDNLKPYMNQLNLSKEPLRRYAILQRRRDLR